MRCAAHGTLTAVVIHGNNIEDLEERQLFGNKRGKASPYPRARATPIVDDQPVTLQRNNVIGSPLEYRTPLQQRYYLSVLLGDTRFSAGELVLGIVRYRSIKLSLVIGMPNSRQPDTAHQTESPARPTVEQPAPSPC